MREKEAMQGNGVERYGLQESEIVGSERTNESLAKVCTITIHPFAYVLMGGRQGSG